MTLLAELLRQISLSECSRQFFSRQPFSETCPRSLIRFDRTTPEDEQMLECISATFPCDGEMCARLCCTAGLKRCKETLEKADKLHPIAESWQSFRAGLTERCDMRSQNEIQKLPAQRWMRAEENRRSIQKKTRRGVVVSQRSVEDCTAAWTVCLGYAFSTLRQEMAR
jgi:hypothetical protein